MGTCVSKCYPCFPCHPTLPCNNSISTAGISPAVHPHPLPGEAGAASASPTTSSLLSQSLVASTSLCASSSSSAASSSSQSRSQFQFQFRRPRELVLLPSATTTTTSSSSMSSRSRGEWDIAVLDPKSKPSDSGRCKPIVSDGVATPTPKRARSVSPLSNRPAHQQQQQQHKKKKRENAGRSTTTATQRRVVAQDRTKDNKKTDVSQSLRTRVEAKTSSSAHANSTPATPGLVTVEDDLTNPIISMDCFIFL